MPQAENPPVIKQPRPRQKLLMSIDLFERAIVVSRRHAGRVIRHFANTGELIKLLSGMGERAAVSSNWNRVGDNVLATSVDSDGQSHALVVRPGRRTMLNIVVGKRQFRLAGKLPNLLADISGTVRHGKLTWSAIEAVYAFAGAADKLNAATVLHAPPLPNCYEDGSVCMGDVDIKRWGHLPAAEAFENAFVKTFFNDHGLANTMTAEAKKKYRTVIDAMRRNKGAVPLELLAVVGPAGGLLAGLWARE